MPLASTTAGRLWDGPITSGGHPHAFLLQRRVHARPRHITRRNRTAKPYGINDSGQVVGEAQPGAGVIDAFVYSNGIVQD